MGATTQNVREGTRCDADLITKLGVVEVLLLDDQLDFFLVSHVIVLFFLFLLIFYKGRHYFPIIKTFWFLFVYLKLIFLFSKLQFGKL